MRVGGSIGENGAALGEPELDANSALTELDKCLRSSKIGEQCEAIVRFPALFERYPFPILINSGFLKLADVFRTGSNFLRLWVLRVCQQSERHLEKILSVDEFIKRIFSVIHSNDPIARALTLRTLGSLSGLIPERKPVHHSIRVALDSHDRVEVSAAIYAASCFAKLSKTFGTTMCTKISSMVQRLATPIDLKLRLIPIFQHMHHDIATAAMVRKLCQELLLSYPAQEFVVTTLHTLTHLAAATTSDITEQVDFLLVNLDDTRSQVKLSILRDLKFLGKKGGHLWEPHHISILINSILTHYSDQLNTNDCNSMDAQIIYTTLDVINSVTSSSAILNLIYSSDTELWKLLETCIHSSDITVALKAIQISAFIAVNWKNEKLSSSGSQLIEMATAGVEYLLRILCSPSETPTANTEVDPSLADLEKCLTFGTLLCKASSAKCEWFYQTVLELLNAENLDARKRNIICQSLGAMGSINPTTARSNVLNLVSLLESWNCERLKTESSTVVTLVAVILQSHEGFSLSGRIADLIRRILDSSNLWVAYRIARNCMRYGQPEIAALALSGSSERVSSEHFHFWLSGLHAVAKAECILSDEENVSRIETRLSEASTMYLQAVSSLKAASSPTVGLQFQTEYLKIRAEMLVAFRNFLVACVTLQFSPPPAIAPAVALANRDELLKSGRIVTQLRKSVREFQTLSEMYARLYQTVFDADNDSLLNIQILQQLCQLVARGIEKVVVSKDHPSFSDDDQAFSFCLDSASGGSTNSQSLIQSCKRAVEVFETLKLLPSHLITNQHIDCLKEAVKIVVETPLVFPRLFFQTLQVTRVKIAVSPQPRGPGESVAVTVGNNLAIKIEGVIEQRGPQGNSSSPDSVKLIRKPKSIRVTVTAAPVPAPNARTHLQDINKMNQEPITLVKEVPHHREFFSAQFLLGMWTSGPASVTVETAVVDFEGRLWITGPRTTLSVRVFEDNSSSVKAVAPPPVPGPGTSRQISMNSQAGVARF